MTSDHSSAATPSKDAAPQVPEGAYARLLFRGPDGQNVEKNLLRFTTLIGSGAHSNVQLLDPEIAEAHCIFTIETGGLRVRDLRTVSGTYVNRERVQVADLADGDTVTVGRFSFAVTTNLQSASQLPDVPELAANGEPAVADLTFVGPDGAPLKKNILRPSTLIGSAPGCNLQLVSADISHAHCVLTMEHGCLRVRDLRSDTGTKVNGATVDVAALADGDKLEVGSFSFCVKTNLAGRSLHAEVPPPVIEPEPPQPADQQNAEAGEIEVSSEGIEAERQALAESRAENERIALDLEAQRQELDRLKTELEEQQASVRRNAELLDQAAASHESALQEFAAQTAERHVAEQKLAAERTELETAQLEFCRALDVLKADQEDLRQQREAAVRAEEVITHERETLQQVRDALDVELQALSQQQQEQAAQTEQLRQEMESLEAARNTLQDEQAQLAQQRAAQTEKQHELEEMAGKIELRMSALEEQERAFAAARAAFEADVAAFQQEADALNAQKQKLAKRSLSGRSSVVDEFHIVSADRDEMMVGRDDIQLTPSSGSSNGHGNRRPDEPRESTSVATVSTTSLAGGGLGRAQIEWLLDGHRYRGFFIGRYRVLELLGTGSTGWLYEAEDTRDGRTVVLKVLSAQHLTNAGMRARFELESRASLEVDHPNIIRAFEAGKADDAPYLVMEVAYGATLQELIELNGPIPCAHACDMIAQAARGLQHIHDAGIVHRDIKPANLLLLHDGGLKIIDFGLALIRGDADELSLKVDHGHDCLGTADYIPPEQARDSFAVDATADVYSLGCTLYFALTGKVPFPHSSVGDKLRAHRDHSPQRISELVSDVPEEVSDIVETMMAKDCSQRYQTAAEVAQVLKPFAQHGPVYFDFHELLARRAATAKKRMFLLAKHDIGRSVTKTDVATQDDPFDEPVPVIEPELAGS